MKQTEIEELSNLADRIKQIVTKSQLKNGDWAIGNCNDVNCDYIVLVKDLDKKQGSFIVLHLNGTTSKIDCLGKFKTLRPLTEDEKVKYKHLMVDRPTPKTVLTDEDEEGWWINESGAMVLNKHGVKETVGVSAFMEWLTSVTLPLHYRMGKFRKATPEEIQTRLTKVAEGMGFKEGVTINKSGINALFSIKFNPISGKFIYYESRDILGSEDGNGYVYRSGQWATIVSQPKPHEMIKGKWYIGNEPKFGNWLFQFDEYRPDGVYVSESYTLSDMKSSGGGHFSDSFKTRDLLPEEEAKYDRLMRDKVTVGGHEVRVQGQTITIGAILYTDGAIKAMLGCSQILKCKVTLHGETMTTEKLQKLIDLIDGK